LEEALDYLYALLKRIGSLERAPQTSIGKYPAPRSPYKPVLLLTVLRRIEQPLASAGENRVLYADCERDFKQLYCGLFGGSEDVASKVTQAFWYLGSGSPKIWDFTPQPGKAEELRTLIETKAQIKSAPKLQSIVAAAHFKDEDWKLLQDRDVRKALTAFLMSEHFTDVREQLGLLT
jgi:predicted restriction endonuclease